MVVNYKYENFLIDLGKLIQEIKIGWKIISNVTLKKYSKPQGEDPKDPDKNNILYICYKDFRNFKEKNGDKVIEQLNKLIKDSSKRGDNTEPFTRQKINLIYVRKLIHEGKEKEAFATFHRTFPYCMPYRFFWTLRNLLIIQFNSFSI